MLLFIIIVGALSAAAAVALTLLGLTRWIVVGLAAVLITFGITPATYAIGTNVAQADASTYNEYYNGYELAATSDLITCTEDGACAHTYPCDYYYTTETYTTTDSNGDVHTHTRLVQHHHDCPYSTTETSYYVNTTLGQYTIGDHLLTGREWRPSAFRSFTRESAPAFWLAAKKRVDANKPGPVTQVNTYQNYILASQTNLFKKYSDTIATLVKKNLLPAPVSGVQNFYDAPKAYFAGNLPAGIDRAALIKDTAYLDGAVGSKLQGDVHIVFVNAAQAPQPTDYLNSLMAYWQSPTFGKDDISKNSIVIAVGVGTASQLPATAAPAPSATASTPTVLPTAKATPDTEDATKTTPSTVPDLNPNAPVALWVRAATGMPIGNEAMLVDLRNTLENQPINSNFIGRPEMDVHTQAIVHTTGLTESVLFGADKFVRVSMSDNNKGDKGLGYKYLEASVPIPTSAFVVISIIIALLGAGLLALAAYLSAMMSGSGKFNYTSRRYSSTPRQY